MMRRRLLIAIAIVAVCGVVFAQPPAESAIGTCASYRIALDKLSAADHEIAEGYVSIGKLTLMAPPDGDAMMRLRELSGEDVELFVRPVKCRAQERIVR